jgi:hypothetical protein
MSTDAEDLADSQALRLCACGNISRGPCCSKCKAPLAEMTQEDWGCAEEGFSDGAILEGIFDPALAVLDQEFIGTPPYLSNAMAGSWWQSFTPSIDGVLCKMKFLVDLPVAGCAVQVLSGEGTGGTVLWSGTVALTAGMTEIPMIVPVVAGQKYTFYLVLAGVDTPNYDMAGGYAGGRSDINAGYDYVFEAWVADPIEIPFHICSRDDCSYASVWFDTKLAMPYTAVIRDHLGNVVSPTTLLTVPTAGEDMTLTITAEPYFTAPPLLVGVPVLPGDYVSVIRIQRFASAVALLTPVMGLPRLLPVPQHEAFKYVLITIP